jgi:hypothetical protein
LLSVVHIFSSVWNHKITGVVAYCLLDLPLRDQRCEPRQREAAGGDEEASAQLSKYLQPSAPQFIVHGGAHPVTLSACRPSSAMADAAPASVTTAITLAISARPFSQN